MTDERAGTSEQCPYGYSDPRDWCRWRNETMTRRDVEWIVGPAGTPMLVDREDRSERRTKDMAAQREAERRRHNHRMNFPLAGTGHEGHSGDVVAVRRVDGGV